ncbi:hypothetical protein M9Y10_029624 [Tritrichomonas musculus]|uniref:Uncharacterized protein n=1 Tax=Tritrichomonas musculus TaxID=1915356 RepID=A0ABR2KNJ3_9EUKA
MGISVSDFSCIPNSIKIEATIIAIILDEKDIISDITIDAIENRIPIIDGCIAAADRTTIFKTRYESRNFYGDNSQIANWCKKADSFRSSILRKPIPEISNIKKEDYPNELIRATSKAIEDCKSNSFTAINYKLNLSISSSVDKTATTNSTKTSQGLACIFSYFSSVVIDDDGRILSVLLDSIEPKITYDNNGNVLKRDFEGSKREIGNFDFSFKNKFIGLKSGEIESINGLTNNNQKFCKLVEKASVFKKTAIINSISYRFGEKVEVPITDIEKDRFVSIQISDNISYRPLTEFELKSGRIELTAESDTCVKFYRYGLFLDDNCIIAGDTNKNRILLSDFLTGGLENTYCFGYDSFVENADSDKSGVICATNDLWKVYNIRYVYSGYYQVNVDVKNDKNVLMMNKEKAYKANPIPPGKEFPFCDSVNPDHLLHVDGGRKIVSGTYYVKKETVFTDGINEYIINDHENLFFS